MSTSILAAPALDEATDPAELVRWITSVDRALDAAMARRALPGLGAAVRQAHDTLRRVEAALGAVAARADGSRAARLRAAHDTLSSHLLAASACASEGLPAAAVANLLRRAAAATAELLAARPEHQHASFSAVSPHG